MNLLAKKIKLHPLTHFPVGRVTASKSDATLFGDLATEGRHWDDG